MSASVRGPGAARGMFAVLGVVACASSTDTTGTSESTTQGTTGTTSSPTSTTSGTGGDSTEGPTPVRGCNGHAVLCDRRLDEVTFATTHNSAAATSAGFSSINANQVHGLAQQLDDGVRGMMLDVTELDGDTWLCHGPCGLGKLLHIDALTIIGDFLDQHPDEVLFIIYEDSTSAAAIAADWQAVGLESLLFTKSTDAWPTLGAMIDGGTRVVVTAENGSPPPGWFHHAWDLVWDTPYLFHSTAEFSCDANRGTAGSGLLLVNHWVSTASDLPDQNAAAAANDGTLLLQRAEQCAGQWNHAVNLLAVDFYDTGELFAVVDALNGV